MTSENERRQPEAQGYEILREVGRGGTSVVYQARHLGLDRVVALKMLLAGGHVGPDEWVRFRNEAETLARLQHPHIVQIHEVGEHNGLPYISLEFCAGGSLDSRLKSTPLPPRVAAALVEKLARAVDTAHQKGVIHRDLKPANVLLTEDNIPKITDFGLARNLGEISNGLTRPGALMGTPSYMAPEQAAGKAGEIGPACDVYALGAILYECLTARPPFQAATPLDTLAQVVGEEPVPPSQLQPGTPRDIETICLKCLRKEPGKRYGSASALAEDLRRFQAGEPVVARPVGWLERGWRWCVRKPAVACLLLGLVAALVASTIFSASYGVKARRRALAHSEQKKKLEELRKQVESSNNQHITGIARSQVARLSAPGQPGTGSPALDAILEVAAAREKRLRLRFVEVALETPENIQQLRHRAVHAMHAVVCLDSGCRAEVEQLLVKRLADRDLSPTARLDLAVCLAALGDVEPSAAREATAILTHDMTSTKDVEVLRRCVGSLKALAGRLDRRDANRVCAQAAGVLSRTIARTTDSRPQPGLARDLVGLAEYLEPRQLAAILIEVLAQSMDPENAGALLDGLNEAAAHLEPKEAEEVAAAITQAMTRAASNKYCMWGLAQALWAVTLRLEDRGTAAAYQRATAVISQAMFGQGAGKVNYALGESLAMVARHLEPREAKAVATTLVQAMIRVQHHGHLRDLGQALAAVAEFLEPEEVKAMADTLTQGLAPMGAEAMQSLAVGLYGGASRDAREPRILRSCMTRPLIRIIARTRESKELGQLGQALKFLEAPLEPGAAREATATIIQAMKRTTNGKDLGDVAGCLESVAAPLTLAEAREAVAILTPAMSRKDVSPSVGIALAGVLQYLEPSERKELLATLVRGLDTKENSILFALAGTLAHLVPRLDRKEAVAVCSQAVAAVTQAIIRTSDHYTVNLLVSSLFGLVSFLEPGEARAAAERIAGTLNPKNVSTQEDLAVSLNWLSERMEPREAESLLIQALTRVAGSRARTWLVNARTAVWARLGPRDGMAFLIEALKQPTSYEETTALMQHLEKVTDRMEPREAAAILIQAMDSKSASLALNGLSQALVKVVPRLEHPEAIAACAQAAAILARSSGTGKRSAVPDRLVELAAYLEPRAAVTVCAPTATALIQAVAPADSPGASYEAWQSAPSLRAVLTRLTSEQRERRIRHGTELVLLGLKPLFLPLAPARAGRALEPLPEPLPPEMLAELLKDPQCVGPARRIVLDVLGTHYQRQFRDQWDFVRFATEGQLGFDFTKSR